MVLAIFRAVHDTPFWSYRMQSLVEAASGAFLARMTLQISHCSTDVVALLILTE